MQIRENDIIVLHLPAYQSALVFRVKALLNRGFERFEYGPLPLKSGISLPTVDGTTVTVPADGVFPARAITPTSITFPSPYDPTKSDMWYVPKDRRSHIRYITLKLRPEVLRVLVELPQGLRQLMFQEVETVRYASGADVFGFRRGEIDWWQMPGIHVGLLFANLYNIHWMTYASFTYQDMIIEIPKIADLIFDALIGKVRAHWFTLPITTPSKELEVALDEVYGFRGFKLYSAYERDRAIREYEEDLRRVRV